MISDNIIIWTYWHSSTLPCSIKRCIESWKTHHPKNDIKVLHKSNYKSYTNNIDVYNYSLVKREMYLAKSHNKDINSVHTRASDFIRFLLLAINGGIWMDASTLCTQNIFDTILINIE
jgi:mannosyltransferase OCH1-like enzyme